MRSFLKFVFATIIGLFISVFLLVAIVTSMGSGSSSPKISTNSVLKLNLAGELPDMSIDDPFSNFNPLSGSFSSIFFAAPLAYLFSQKTLQKKK